MDDPTRARRDDLAYLTYHTIRGLKILAVLVLVAGVIVLVVYFS